MFIISVPTSHKTAVSRLFNEKTYGVVREKNIAYIGNRVYRINILALTTFFTSGD